MCLVKSFLPACDSVSKTKIPLPESSLIELFIIYLFPALRWFDLTGRRTDSSRAVLERCVASARPRGRDPGQSGGHAHQAEGKCTWDSLTGLNTELTWIHNAWTGINIIKHVHLLYIKYYEANMSNFYMTNVDFIRYYIKSSSIFTTKNANKYSSTWLQMKIS